MRTCQFKALKAIALGAAISLGAFSAASASPVAFTWNPSATGNTTAGTFTADNFTLTDWASIHVPANPMPAGSVSETGFLELNGFTLNGTPVSTVHTTGTGGYGVYESFTATSHLSPSGGNLVGSFDSISAQTFLYSTANGLASYSFSGGNPAQALPAGANPVLIANQSGPLSNSVLPNITQITDGVPNASVGTTWTDVLGKDFFISPSGVLNLDQAFTNTKTVITISGTCSATGTDCTYEINGGGGNGNFSTTPVPEPGSLLLLGTGLIALGVVGVGMRRRRYV